MNPVKKRILENLRISRNKSFIYLNNPKSAATSVKNTLVNVENDLGLTNIVIQAGRELHNPYLEVFEYSPESFKRGLNYCFSFVRNPYARALSVYLEKIEPGTDQGKEFRRAINVDERKNITFHEFLHGIVSLPIEKDNIHWRSQSFNLMIGKLPIHFIGYVESFEEDMSKVIQHIYGKPMPVTSYTRHSVSANGRLHDYVDDEAIELIKEKYEEDFDNFNYSTDYTILSSLKKPEFINVSKKWINDVEMELHSITSDK